MVNRSQEPKMAKNPYLKQHKDFCEWIDRDRDTMPPTQPRLSR